jgi:hypothetical protein
MKVTYGQLCTPEWLVDDSEIYYGNSFPLFVHLVIYSHCQDFGVRATMLMLIQNHIRDTRKLVV